jgi:copper chaperone CopZ
MRVVTTILLSVLVAAMAVGADAPAKPQAASEQTVVHRVMGLFDADREKDLRAAVEKVPGIRVVSVDVEYGEATFAYDPAVAFKGTKPDKIVERFNEWLRNASGHMLGIKARTGTPREKLSRVEVMVAPLDCRACALAVHEIVTKVDGVEQALVDMKAGRISVVVDPGKVDAEKIRAELKRREVTLAQP